MYYLKESKTLKRGSSVETIVDFLCDYDKHADELFVITQCHNGYSLLKQILEKDAPFAMCQGTYLLGFERDRSGLYSLQINVIAVQAAAQATAYAVATEEQYLVGRRPNQKIFCILMVKCHRLSDYFFLY